MRWEPTVNIDVERLITNITWLKDSSGQTLAPVLKSNAYGHGLAETVQALSESDLELPFIAVAGNEDAFRVRALTSVPVLFMGAASSEELTAMRRENIMCSLTSIACAAVWWNLKDEERPRAHVLVDTGLGRLGIEPRDLTETLIPELQQRGLVAHGLFIHPASADTGDVASVDGETVLALNLAARMRELGLLTGPTHLGASSTLFLDQSARGEITRLGIGLFGYLQDHFLERGGIRPALAVEARVVHTKFVAAGQTFGYSHKRVLPESSLIATVNFGVSHGLNPKAEQVWHIDVHGEPCRIIETTLDYSIVGPVPPETRVGDTVLIMGGDDEYSVEKHAALLGIIPDHVIAALSPTVTRKLVPDSKPRDGSKQ